MHSFAALMLRFRRSLERDGATSAPLLCRRRSECCALALRLYGLGDKPFWLDEVASLRRATATVPDLVVDSLHNNHYPSYFLLLWLVGQIGTSQWLLRLPSAVFGALGASLTCAIGRQAAGPRSGVIAGLLMAVSPFEVQFGQEARSYTLVSCLILTALFGLVRLAQEPAAAALPMRQRERPARRMDCLLSRHRGRAQRAQRRDPVADRRQSERHRHCLARRRQQTRLSA